MTEHDRKFHVTLFEDEFAQTIASKEMTLDELRDLVLSTTAATKGGLPLLSSRDSATIEPRTILSAATET